MSNEPYEIALVMILEIQNQLPCRSFILIDDMSHDKRSHYLVRPLDMLKILTAFAAQDLIVMDLFLTYGTSYSWIQIV